MTTNRIIRLSNDGRYQSMLDGDSERKPYLYRPWLFKQVGGLATDRAGHLFVIDAKNSRVQRWNTR